jgi:DNA-binding MarR family transcriptional regulator
MNNMKRPLSPDDVDQLTHEIGRNCLLTRTRRIGRVVTAVYDDELRPHGIGAAQFSLLVLIARVGGATRADIGRANSQERSTLSRNLALLLNEGWVEEGAGKGRGRPISISAAGRELLQRAAPGWRTAQAKARNLLGEAGASSLMSVGDSL